MSDQAAKVPSKQDASPPEAETQCTLVQWANKQEGWVRAIVAEAMASGAELSEDQVCASYERMLREKALAGGVPDEVPLITGRVSSDAAEADLRLAEVKDIRGINALSPGQHFEVHPRATIFFGENGAGKTGYVRILKLLASARAAEPLVPDVSAGAAPTTPHALVKFTLGDKEDALEWSGESGVVPFTRMDVFDSRSTQIYLDQELSFTYTPRELAYFKSVRQALDQVREKLQAAKNSAPTSNPFLPHFRAGTSSYALVAGISGQTDPVTLEAAAAVSDKEKAELEPLRKRVAQLRADSAGAALQVARTNRALFVRVQAAVRPFAALIEATYRERQAVLVAAKATHDQETRAALLSESIPGVLTDAWRAFIEAGHAYWNELGSEVEEREGEPCIYCRQPLGEKAAALLKKYRAYCHASKKPVDDARARLLELTTACRQAALTDLDRDIPAAELIEETRSEVKVIKQSRDFLDGALSAQQTLLREELADVGACRTKAESLLQEIEETLARLDKEIQSLGKAGDERVAALAAEELKLHELEDKLVLAERLASILEHVEKMAWAARAEPVLARIPVITRQLTDAMKAASKQLVNADFERLFMDECKALRAPAVKLEFPGRSTEGVRRKSLTRDHKLSEILSEGEQRVVALADFLAETSLRPKVAPIVFDDPVNSLDYKRINYVADRVVGLSATRQLIVFTHNIWFTVELLARLGRSNCYYYDVQDDGRQRGIVTRGTEPRTDTVSSLTRRINPLVERARSQSGEEQFETLEKLYELMRNYCEVFVEKELLREVSGRFQPHIHMTNLPKIHADRLDSAVKSVTDVFDRSCRRIASHSQPRETLNTRPTLKEVEDDWSALQAARNAYIAGD